MATRHDPQLPAQQPDSMRTPSPRANSSRFPAEGSHRTTFPDRPNVTFTFERNSVSFLVGSAAFFFTVAGPNASKWTSFSGTPQASSPSVISFMNAPFPQRKY